MTSPARQHRQAILAEEMSKPSTSPRPAAGAELLWAQLAEHKRLLKQIQSHQQRNEKKAELMAEWHGHIDAVLQADGGQDDRVMSQMLPWCFDVGDYTRGLAVGHYLLRHRLPPPEGFARDLPALFAELCADAALKEPSALDAEALQGVVDAVADADMVDEIRAKLYRALGEALQESDPSAAIDWLNRAIDYNPKVGAKATLAKLTKSTPPA